MVQAANKRSQQRAQDIGEARERSAVETAESGAETYLTHPGFLAEVEARARAWGALIGAAYGEAYRAAGPFAVRDARALLGYGAPGGVA